MSDSESEEIGSFNPGSIVENRESSSLRTSASEIIAYLGYAAGGAVFAFLLIYALDQVGVVMSPGSSADFAEQRAFAEYGLASALMFGVGFPIVAHVVRMREGSVFSGWAFGYILSIIVGVTVGIVVFTNILGVFFYLHSTFLGGLFGFYLCSAIMRRDDLESVVGEATFAFFGAYTGPYITTPIMSLFIPYAMVITIGFLVGGLGGAVIWRRYSVDILESL